jgi:hypothetical protein
MRKDGYWCKKCQTMFRAKGRMWDGYLVKCKCGHRCPPIRWDPDGKVCG